MKNYHTILLQVTTSILLLLTISIQVRAQVGNLLWEEEFEKSLNFINLKMLKLLKSPTSQAVSL